MKTRGRRQSSNVIESKDVPQIQIYPALKTKNLADTDPMIRGMDKKPGTGKPGEYMEGWAHTTKEFPKSGKKGRVRPTDPMTTSSTERTKYAK